jgi:hypothetical protein
VNNIASEHDRCKHGHDRRHGHNEHCDVAVVFNGVGKDFKIHASELVRSLLDRAIHDFHIAQNPHTYGLFNKDNVELNDKETLHAAGVRCCDTLLLRPSVVRAGKC